MKPDYKNWVPRGMIFGLLGGAVLCGAVFAVLGAVMTAGALKTALRIIFLAGTLILAIVALWMYMMHRAFSYDGKRQMSRQIINGVAQYVKLPDGGKGLDVGCGSGALTIACAKRNPNAEMIGVDRWGKDYASFTNSLCEKNAQAEGVSNVSFQKGNALKLDFPDESFDAVTSNYVYHNIPARDRQEILLETLRVLKKGGTFALHDIMSKSKYGDMQAFLDRLKALGYEKAELINTADGKFMTAGEARWMQLSGSALLVGRK